MAALPEGLDSGKKIGLGRIALDVAEKGSRQVAISEKLHNAVDQRQIAQAFVGDDQWSSHPIAASEAG
jgi:hypothetical protein